MKKVFLDTNILMDVALQRDYSSEGEKILQLGDSGLVQLCASSLTYANIAYVLRKHPRAEMYQYLRMLREGINVVSLDAKCLDAALKQEVSDFEDMLQYQCALNADCDYVISNNTKHFEEFCSLPLYTSKEFVESDVYKGLVDSATDN